MPAILEFVVAENDDGKTVEKLLKREFGISSTLMKNLKLNSKLTLNDIPCRSVDICKTNDIIRADVSEQRDNCHIQPVEANLDILFEDDFILVVNKPGNMASHPCPGNRENSLASVVMYHWSKMGEYHNYHIVNRLDKGTSGICVIAKNQFSHGVIARQMKMSELERGYTAIVHGSFESTSGSIELPIKRAEGSVIKRIVSDDGKYAKTNYKVKRNCGDFSLIDVHTETGRTHQIRVHFSHIGHPLVGDWLYGNGDAEKHLIDRQALHFGYLKFFHPADKRELIFVEKMPQDMKKILLFCENRMEKQVNES